MDLIPKNYQEMISIPGNQDNELNKFFETIDNLNKPFKLNESKFGLNIRDENGNSILHRIIINSLNEQELLNKIQFIPNIETLIKGVSSIITKKDKGKEDIRYDILDSKNRLPLSYLVMGVDIDKIRASNILIPEDIKSTDSNLNKMMEYFNGKTNCNDDVNIGTNLKFDNDIDKKYVDNDIYHLILNNKYVKRYINKSFIEDIYENTTKTVPYDRFANINVDNMSTLNYFIKDDKTIKSISTIDYYFVFSKYINNKLISLNDTFIEIHENKRQKFINDNVQKIIETKTSLINKVFMDNNA